MLTDWTDTRTREQASTWERTVAATAIPCLDSLGKARGAELLARTAGARLAVVRYLHPLDRARPVVELMTELIEGATKEELQEARRLARTEGLIGLPERACYDLAALLIVRHGAVVEGDRDRFWGQDPNQLPELKWRFHLLASQLYPERGWELMDFNGPADPGATAEDGA